MKTLLLLLGALLLPLAASADPLAIRAQCEEWAMVDEIPDAGRSAYIADCVGSLEEEEEEEPLSSVPSYEDAEAESEGDGWSDY